MTPHVADALFFALVTWFVGAWLVRRAVDIPLRFARVFVAVTGVILQVIAGVAVADAFR